MYYPYHPPCPCCGYFYHVPSVRVSDWSIHLSVFTSPKYHCLDHYWSNLTKQFPCKTMLNLTISILWSYYSSHFETWICFDRLYQTVKVRCIRVVSAPRGVSLRWRSNANLVVDVHTTWSVVSINRLLTQPSMKPSNTLVTWKISLKRTWVWS